MICTLFIWQKKKVLKFIGIKIRWKLSKLNNLLIMVCVVYWATLGCNPNTQKNSLFFFKEKIKNLMTYWFFIFGYKQIDIIYQIDFLVYHGCVPFFIWPKINRFWNLLLVINQIETFSNKHWKRYYLLLICSFLFDPNKYMLLEFIGIKIRLKLSKLKNLLNNFLCNPNKKKKQPYDLLIFYFRLQTSW